MKLKQAHKHYSAGGKSALLRCNLEKGEPVSKLCEEQTLRPTVFYRWKKEFFEGSRRRCRSAPLDDSSFFIKEKKATATLYVLDTKKDSIKPLGTPARYPVT